MKTPKITQKEIGIIKAAQAGSISAFNRLFYKYKSFVSNVLYDYIKDKDEANDITNIVFLRVFEKLSSFTAYESFGGWLRIISKNIAIDYLREMKNKTSVPEDSVDRLSTDESVYYGEDELVNHMTYKQILQEFDKLPELHKRVCKLHFIDGLSAKSIAETLSIPIGTSKSILLRTQKRIKQKF